MSSRIEQLMKLILPKTTRKLDVASKETQQEIELSAKSREDTERVVFEAYEKVGKLISTTGSRRQ